MSLIDLGQQLSIWGICEDPEIWACKFGIKLLKEVSMLYVPW